MRLSPEQIDLLKLHPSFSEVLLIAETLKKNGNECFIVGGGVRDLLLGVCPKDLDLVSEAKPEEIKRLFAKALSIGEAFGIMVLPTSAGPVELATFRKESLYTDGRHPEKIEFSDMIEDAKRRDFTVNSLYLNLNTFEVSDLQNGIADIKAKILRTVGDAKTRFSEDRLRLLRLVRFAIYLDFKIEKETLIGAQSLGGELKGVSAERIREEFLRSLQTLRSIQLPQLLHDVGLSKTLIGTRKFNEARLKEWKHIEAGGEVSLSARFFLFLWVHEFNESDAVEWLRRIKMPKEYVARVGGIYKAYSEILNAAENESSQKLFKGKIFRRLAQEPDDFLFRILEQFNAPIKVKQVLMPLLSEFKTNLLGTTKIVPVLSSEHLKELGIKPSPQFGEILNRGFEIQLEFGFKKSEEIIRWLKSNGLL